MKKRNTYILTAAALFALAACSKENATQEAAGSICIEASVGTSTKVTSTGFVKDDQIAVYAWTGSAASIPAKPVVNGIVNTFDGTKWAPATMMEWENAKDAHYFLGIYPVPASVSSFTNDPFVLNPDNQGASDLLVATSLDGITPSGDPVELEFNHVMAKLNVNLKFRTEFESTPTVSSVTAKAKGSATVNYLTKTVTATGSATSIALQALSDAATGYDLSYSCIQVPQTGVRTITINIGGQKYEYNATDDIPLESGKYTTLGLMVGKDKELIELETVTVDDWLTGENYSSGVAERLHDGHAYVDMGDGIKWATCNLGAENEWECGDYFAWGVTETYYLPGHGQEDPPTHWRPGKSDGYTWSNYKHCVKDDNVCYNYMTYIEGWGIIKYNDLPKYGHDGFVDDKYVLDQEDDAAHILWGGSWRIPTGYEFRVLAVSGSNYSREWVKNYKGKGVDGLLITRVNGPCKGNTVFLPAARQRYNTDLGIKNAGYYWSTDIGNNPFVAHDLEFDKDSHMLMAEERYAGLSIRPVSY